MTVYYIGLLAMTLLGSIASLFLKKASGADSIMKLATNINLYIGGGLYLTSAIINIIVLRVLDYSVVLPLTSITYIWTMVWSYLILHEKITKRKMIGVMVIIAGAIMISL